MAKASRSCFWIDNLRNIRYNYTYNVDGSIASVEKRDPATAALISTDTYSYDSAKRLEYKEYGAVGHTYRPIYEHDDSERIYPDDNVIGITLDGKFTDRIATDGLHRTATRTLTLADDTPLISDSYAYYTSVNDEEDIPCTCDYVNSLTTSVCGNSVGALSYTYDKAGNIETVSENGIVIAKYYYDSINRLVREDNAADMSTYVWTYDAGGNITSKKTYGFSHDLLLENCIRTDVYGYNSPRGWKDQLTSYNLLPITYDEIGNPLTYKGNNLTWTHVRRLASYGSNTFEYGADGIRTKKNGITYVFDGNKILYESDGCSRSITYYYGTNGVVGFNYNGTDYYYRKNLQGDVIEIYDSDGNLVAKYAYDAWGRVISVKDANNNVNTDDSFIGNINPFRYRSYYYDTETGLYYLNSRYYDPETGRFINADDVQYLDPETLGGINLYAYCLNNPVMYADPSGNSVILTIALILMGVGVAAGLGYAAYTDYQDDNDINGSVGWRPYFGFTLLGGAIGFGLGYFGPLIASFLGSSFSFTLPALGTLNMGGVLALVEGATVTVTGAQLVGGAIATTGIGITLFAKGFGPRMGHNQHEKQMWNEAMNQLDIRDKDLI